MNLYIILGVQKELTCQEIAKIAKKLMMGKHPDQGGDPEIFKAILEAYEILTDPERRDLYDRTGATTKIKTIRNEAMEQVFQMFNALVEATLVQDNYEMIDIFATMRNQITQTISATHRDMEAIKAMLVRMEKLNNRIHSDLGIFKEVMDSKITKNKEELHAREHKVKVLTEMIEILKGSKTEILQQISTIQYTSTSTTGSWTINFG